MAGKDHKIERWIQAWRGRDLDARYLGFFACFNQERFFEAHEVLESLWLMDRQGTNGAFYKGLIQLAGAFVHVQKRRWGPATALLRLAQGNLAPYPARHEQLRVDAVLEMIARELREMEAAIAAGQPGRGGPFPRIELSLAVRSDAASAGDADAA